MAKHCCPSWRRSSITLHHRHRWVSYLQRSLPRARHTVGVHGPNVIGVLPSTSQTRIRQRYDQ